MSSLKVSIVYGDLKAEFEGDPGEVYLKVVNFLERSIPAYSLASKLNAFPGVEELLEKLSEMLAYTPSEGVFVKKTLSSLPTSNAILLYAASRYLNNLLGFTESSECSASELAEAVGKPEKTVSGRLTELVQRAYLRRVGRGGYVITPNGLNYLVESSAI
ncbi:MAG: hypothetical protein RMH74_08760 [Candidatus Caldarchaeum sp.]|nr:hypothetical protein [Candidatus Caldarchaeum sp.]